MEPIELGNRSSMSPLQGLSRVAAKRASEESGAGKALESFGEMLKNHLAQVNQLDEEADQLKEDYAVGKPVELHNVMIADSKADLAMELTMQLRNKALSAYQNVWQTNI